MKKILLQLAILLLTATTATSQVTTEEFEALKALYKSTNGGSWTNNTGWDTITNNVSDSWYGIDVTGSNVITIQLYLNNLKGTLPVEIGNFPNLKNLILYSNQISGNIPIEIGNLTNLDWLILNENQLTGNIPNTIENISNISDIDLHSNQLTGSIPANIGNLSNLTSVNLRDNQLSGSIPSNITNLTNLVYLYLYNNQFSGTLPTNLGNLGNLEYLWISNNNFTGSIPTNIGNLANLIEADFSHNQFEGPIPEGLGNIATLTDLDISFNKYTFEDFEAVIDTLPGFTALTPQDSLAVDQEEYNLTEGDALNLSLTTGGEYNVYQWYKGSSTVSEKSSSPDFSIAQVTLSNAGTYHCRVTNTLVTNSQVFIAVLYSKKITVNIAEDTTATAIHDPPLIKVQLYPNPAVKQVIVKAPNIKKISIQNTAGQTVLLQQINGENEIMLNISNMESGIYIMIIETEDNVYSRKFVKL